MGVAKDLDRCSCSMRRMSGEDGVCVCVFGVLTFRHTHVIFLLLTLMLLFSMLNRFWLERAIFQNLFEIFSQFSPGSGPERHVTSTDAFVKSLTLQHVWTCGPVSTHPSCRYCCHYHVHRIQSRSHVRSDTACPELVALGALSNLQLNFSPALLQEFCRNSSLLLCVNVQTAARMDVRSLK